jgi:hypothetical protein
MKEVIKTILREGLVIEQRIPIEIVIPNDIIQIKDIFIKNNYKLYVVGGVINKELTLKDREWTCETCGLVHDRDILASNNIKKFALNAIGLGQPELTPIESKSLDPRGNRNPIGL